MHASSSLFSAANFDHLLCKPAAAPNGRLPRVSRPARGFTLVELMMVIGILSLLMSLLLPALSKARQAANTTKCAANLRSIGQALTAYINENRHYPGSQSATGGTAFGIWAPRLRKHLSGDQRVFWCPATDPGLAWKPGDVIPGCPIATAAHVGWGYNMGESVLQVDKKQFSYGYNDWGTVDVYKIVNGHYFYFGLGGDCWMVPPPPPNQPDQTEVKEPDANAVVSAGECIVITDVVAQIPAPGSWLMNVDPRTPSQAPAKVHAGGSNALFCDGHVGWMLQADLCCFDPKTGAATTGATYDRVSKLWNRDNQSH